MLELLLALLLAAGAVIAVLRPILRPETTDIGDADAGSDDAGEDPDDDLSPRAVALRALKEIEFDRATGKLSDEDYRALQAKYTAEAVAAIRRDEGRGTREESPVSRPVCPADGPRPESDAVFCSTCGRRLGEGAPGFCTRCGAELETDARFCGRCGVRVAA